MTVQLGSTGVYSCWVFGNSGGGGVVVTESDLHAVDFWCVILRNVNFSCCFGR